MYAVYLTTITAGQYVGRTQVTPGETAGKAVADRIREHAKDPGSALYQHIKHDPEGAVRATTVESTPSTEAAAIKAEQDIYDGIPPHRRLNRVRPS